MQIDNFKYNTGIKAKNRYTNSHRKTGLAQYRTKHKETKKTRDCRKLRST